MTDEADGIWQEIDELLYSGHNISAIKLLRERTGVNLADAKRAVEARIELRRGNFAARRASSEEPSAMIDELDGNWKGIDNLLYSGQKIPAIKLLRERTGASLAEAKRDVEARIDLLRAQSPGKFTVPPQGGGCLGVLVVSLVALAEALWLI